MRFFKFISLVLMGFSGIARGSSELSDQQIPTVHINVSISDIGSGPNRIKGSLAWARLAPDIQHSVCFYLPYNDPEFGTKHGSMGRFESITGSQPQANLHDGYLRARIDDPDIQVETSDSDHLLKIKLPPNWSRNDSLKMEIEGEVPRHKFSDQNDWFYDGLLPQVLPTCETQLFNHLHFMYTNYAHFVGQIRIPESWTYQGPGIARIDSTIEIDQIGTTVAFALQKNPERIDISVAGIPIHIYPRSKSFLPLISTLEEVLPSLIEKLGPPPFTTLSLVETTEIQRAGLPGIIAMNRPAQPIFDKIQVDWVNWRHWSLTSQLIKQWYGGAISAQSPDDNWLIEGLVEYVLLEILSSYPDKWDLFRPVYSHHRLLSFNYLQLSEIFAGLLWQGAPFSTLTNNVYHSLEAKQDQNNLLFIRNVFALRQISDLGGNSLFFKMLRSLNKEKKFRHMSPQDFLERIDHLPSPYSPSVRLAIKEDLRQWWTLDGWPDFQISSFKAEELPDGKWIAKLEVNQVGKINFAPMVAIIDDTHRTYNVRASHLSQKESRWYAEVVTSSRPKDAIVDPLHVTFDTNRFDNSTSSFDVVFLPGTTNTLRDDAYTVLWAPYPQRRPGEAFSIGIGASIRHYLESGLSLRAEYAPGTHRGSYSINQDVKWPTAALSANFSAIHTYFNDRRLSASLTRSPLFSVGPRIEVSTKLRKKEEAGIQNSRHFTYGFALAVKPSGTWASCQPSLALEWEKAPSAWAKNFSYERRTSTALGSCSLSRGIGLRIKAFIGRLDASGTPPVTSQFRPNDLYETGLRLDRSMLRVNRISAIETDLYLPLLLPISRKFIILPRQAKWRLFHDLGKSEDTQTIYRSGGIGFFMPFGGDLAGTGALTLSRLSLLTILYQKVGDDISRRPAIIFDITGEI